MTVTTALPSLPDPVRELYASKLTSAERAVRDIRSGWRVFVGSGCANPVTLIQALLGESDRLHDVEVAHLLTFGIADYVRPEFAGHFRHNAFFIGPNVRQAVREGRAAYTPVFLSELPELLTSGQRRIDAALLQLSPPDRHGYCSMGIHVDVQRAALESSRLAIAEVNPNMPRTFGESQVHLSRLDHIVETNTPLLELPSPAELDAVSLEIGNHVARLIDHGSCLQLGIGSIPNAVLRLLLEKRHLGIHTEMISDGCLPLYENGNIDNSRKAIRPGKTVVSFTMGTRALYDFVDDNPSIEYYPSDFANNPRIICQNDNMVAVNSALQVDLTGQVCADSLGYDFYSGIGGQVDFIRGAAMSRGGKPIIALPSTAKKGQLSRIVPHLDEGAGVVTSRGDVHYVVTEWGVAYLHGKSIRERALALINIAHPDYRSELLDFVKKKHYVYDDEQVWRQAVNKYPADWEDAETFRERDLLVRPLLATDERTLQEFFYSHTEETIYDRYFHVKKELGREEASTLCCVDYHQQMAFGVFLQRGTSESLVAVARYDLNPRTNVAETAVVVGEDWRRLGIGRYLVGLLVRYAKSRGISGFTAEVRPNNAAMLKIHREMGHQVKWNSETGTYRILVRFGEESDVMSDPFRRQEQAG